MGPLVGLAALFFWSEDWGQLPLVLSVLSARVPGAALCAALAEMSVGWWGEEGGPWAGSGSSRHLSLQDCTFFTRKEIMRSVWGERGEDLDTTFYMVLEDICNLTSPSTSWQLES